MSNVNHPQHYNSHPSGVECIDIVEHFNFRIGNAIKYLWRAGRKGSSPKIEDLKKAIFYIQREIEAAEAEVQPPLTYKMFGDPEEFNDRVRMQDDGSVAAVCRWFEKAAISSQVQTYPNPQDTKTLYVGEVKPSTSTNGKPDPVPKEARCYPQALPEAVAREVALEINRKR